MINKSIYAPYYGFLKSSIKTHLKSSYPLLDSIPSIPVSYLCKNNDSDLTIAIHPLSKILSIDLSEISSSLETFILSLQYLTPSSNSLNSENKEAKKISLVSKTTIKGGFIHLDLNPIFSSSILSSILTSEAFSLPYYESLLYSTSIEVSQSEELEKLKKLQKEKIMVEYSQPNTHKVFHIGHMRNVALGSSIINIYRKFGLNVKSANYYGDEGVHISKCLWLLKERGLEEKMDEIKEEKRLEFLGDLYAEACGLLSLKSMTDYPVEGFEFFIVEKIESQEKVDGDVFEGEVKFFDMEEKIKGYFFEEELNSFNDKKEKVFFILYDKGTNSLASPYFNENKKITMKPSSETTSKTSKSSKSSKNSKKMVSISKLFSETIYPKIFPNLSLIEYGAKKISLVSPEEPTRCPVLTVLSRRLSSLSSISSALQSRSSKSLNALWEKTREWSLQNFNLIYSWLRVSFDVIFTESEVSEEASSIVSEYLSKGVFQKIPSSSTNKQKKEKEEESEAVGITLKNSFAVLRKSDGTTLYLTKDLALAQRKFSNFEITSSVYVVDSAQSHHFAQCFEILEKMGFSQSKSCKHIAYGQVVLPTGKMSSRENNTYPFTKLRIELEKEIESKVQGIEELGKEEKEKVLHSCALATIKYGMLSVEKEKSIVFDVDKWTNLQGITGPYLLYMVARINSIQRKVEERIEDIEEEAKVLEGEKEKEIYRKLSKFWDVLERARERNEPSLLANNAYDMCKMFSSWYAVKENSIKYEEDMGKKKSKLMLVACIKRYIVEMLGMLGIDTLERM